MIEPQATPPVAEEPETRQATILYTVLDADQGSPPTEEGQGIRRVTILHTGYGRGLIEPAEDRSCPT